MPDKSQVENGDSEKRKAHNNVEKKRKDKLKSALDDLRKYLPLTVTKNKRLSHHEVLLKAMDYMRDLEKENKMLVSEASDAAKGEIIENLKKKLDESYKEIGDLKALIEKNCTVFHSVDLIQNWKSKGKANKACQASRGLSSSGSSSLSQLINKNKKQKKGFTIAQRLNHATEISVQSMADKNQLKSSEVVDGPCLAQKAEVCVSLNGPFNSLTQRSCKDSNAIILCYNDKFAFGMADNTQISPIIISTLPQQHDISPSAIMNSSVTSGQILPVPTFSVISCLNSGVSYLNNSMNADEPTAENNTTQGKGELINEEKDTEYIEKKAEKLKCSRKTQRGFRVLHCCNWYWKNLKRRKKSCRFNIKRKSLAITTSEESPESTKNSDRISSVSSEVVVNEKDGESDPKDKHAESTEDNAITSEANDSSSSNTSKVSKPIWIVAKNMTDAESSASLSKYCFSDSCRLPDKSSSDQNIKVSNASKVPAEPISSTCSHDITQHKTSYNDMNGLPLSTISSFSDIYDRNTTSKAVDQSFIEDASFYASGVQYLSEDNDLQFEIEDDIFPQSTNSPISHQVSFEKVKHKDGRKDFLSFSFNNESFNSSPFIPTEPFMLQSGFTSSDKGSCSNSTYRQISPQDSINLSQPNFNNFHQCTQTVSHFDFRVTKSISTTYTQSYSAIGKTTFIHSGEKVDYSKREVNNFINKESNNNCMFDSLEKSQFSGNTYAAVRLQKENKNYIPAAHSVPQFETSGVASTFNPYSNYAHDKMWAHSSSTSFFTPKTSFNFQEPHDNTLKNSEATQLFNSHFSSFNMSKLPTDKDKFFPFKAKVNSDCFGSSQVNEDGGASSSNIKFHNSLSIKDKSKVYHNDQFSLSGEGITKVVFTTSHQTSTTTKLWNPDQYALNNKPFSFYPLSYNENVQKNVFNFNNTSSVSEKVSESQQIKTSSESSMFRSDNFFSSNTFLNQDNSYKSSSHILSFVPSIKTSASYSFEESEGLSSNLMSSTLASNAYPPLQNEIHGKANENAEDWPKKSGNFSPYFSCSSTSEMAEGNSSNCQSSSGQKSKVSSFNGGSIRSLVNQAKPSLKKSCTSSYKTAKKTQKVSTQDLFPKCQKAAYHSNQNSYYTSELLVGAFDKPTYLTGEDQFIATYPSDQVADLNINPFAPPPLPSNQTGDMRLNLYQSQMHCTGFPATTTTTTPPLTLSSTRFSSALPSIHHFGIGNIFTDFSHPLTLAVEASNLPSLKASSQGESFMSSPPHYYRDASMTESVAVAAPSSGLLEANYYPNIFNHHAMKHATSKNSMSINNLLGN